MSKERLRIWLLTGMNALAGITVLFFVFDEFSVTRGLIDDGTVLVLVFMAFLLVPFALIGVCVFGRTQTSARPRGQRVYARLSVLYLVICWLVIAAPALIWGALVIAASQPWPLSLAQGPDTERARMGVEKLFGADAAGAMSSVYLYAFDVRDASYFVRFSYAAPGLIERIAEQKDLVSVPLATRDTARYDVRAYRNRWSWWEPDQINRANALYVDRPTSEKMAGGLPPNQPIGLSRVLWVDRTARTAYYREIEF